MKKKGFTLIELLVVIAIIALLLSVIVPSLRLAKRKAAAAVCLINVKNLTLAWYTYQEDHNGRLVNPDPAAPNAHERDNAWIQVPHKENGDPCPAIGAAQVTDEDEQRGIEKGLLFPYIKSFGVFHCPADNQRKSKYDNSKDNRIFRTYSIPHCLGRPGVIDKFSEIKSPGERYVFVEEAETRNYNMGTWGLGTPETLGEGNWEWQDPIGVNHGDSGILGFCDSHAEVHKWRDSHTKDRIEAFYYSICDYYGTFNEEYPRPWDQVEDLNYMVKGWAYKDYY